MKPMYVSDRWLEEQRRSESATTGWASGPRWQFPKEIAAKAKADAERRQIETMRERFARRFSA